MSQQQEVMNNLLIEAVRNRDVPLAKTYVQKGADPNCTVASMAITEKQSINASMQRSVAGPVLHLAGVTGINSSAGFSRPMTDFLIASGASVDAKNKSGNTMLMVAIRAYDASMVEYWLSKGANPLQTDANGNTALKLASEIDKSSASRQTILNMIMTKLPDTKASNAQNNNTPQPAEPVQVTKDIEVMKPVAIVSRKPAKPRGGGFNL